MSERTPVSGGHVRLDLARRKRRRATLGNYSRLIELWILCVDIPARIGPADTPAEHVHPMVIVATGQVSL